METPMTSCFFGQPEYDYTIVTPPADEVCMICLEKYTTEQAIRLTHCGHLIGSECFRDWISVHPETCTYWNHPLPLSDARDPSIVEKFCAEQESEYMELMTVVLEDLYGGTGTMRFRSCLRALWDDPFTLANAAEFMIFHGPMILALSAAMTAEIIFLFLAVAVTAVKFFLSFEVSPITLIKADIVATMKTTSNPSISSIIKDRLLPTAAEIVQFAGNILVVICLVLAVLLRSICRTYCPE